MFALLLLIWHTSGSVIGIDMGSELMKTSLIRPGKRLVIVENEQSKRSTPSAISFSESGREYGYNALKEQVKKPESTILFLHNLFSKTYETQSYFERTFQPIKLDKNSERSSTLLSILNESYETEEIMAMILEYVHSMSEKFGEGTIKDCAITVPTFWTRAQKISLINSAQIAGLNVLALMNENTGAALYYGIDRLDNKTAHYAIFYNLGASYLQVTLAKYSHVNKKVLSTKQIENVEVLAHADDERLGGSLFDSVLAKHLALKFKQIHGHDISENSKAMARLFQQSNSAKKTLSANKSVLVIVNSLFKGIDFSYSLSRDEFEELISPYTERLVDPIFKVVQRSGLTLQDINSLEIVGGVSRVPKVQEIIKAKTGLEISTHLNGDESMAHGAAIYAANFSSVVQVKPIWLSDICTTTYNARFYSDTDKEWTKETVLFKYGSKLGSKKKVMFGFSKDVRVLVEEVKDDKITPLSVYEISGVEKIGRDDLSLFFSFILDYSGIPYLSTADAKYEIEVVDTKKKAKKKLVEEEEDNLKNQGFNKRSSANEEILEKASDNAEVPEDPDLSKIESTYNETISDQNTANETLPKEQVSNETVSNSTHKKTRTETKTVILRLKEIELEQPRMLSQKQVDSLKADIKSLKERENKAKKLAEEKNELEAFLYATDEKVQETSFEKFTSERERLEINSEIAKLREFLESEDFGKSTLSEIRSQKYALERKVKEPLEKEAESRIREEAVRQAYKALLKVEDSLKKLNSTKPWIPVDEMVVARLKLNDTLKWLDRKVNEQKKLADWEPLAFRVSELEAKVAAIEKNLERLKKLTKPKKPAKGPDFINFGDDFDWSKVKMENVKVDGKDYNFDGTSEENTEKNEEIKTDL